MINKTKCAKRSCSQLRGSRWNRPIITWVADYRLIISTNWSGRINNPAAAANWALFAPCLTLVLLLQLPPAQQRGPARGRLSHLPVSGDGADPAVQRDELFPPGNRSNSVETPSAQPRAGKMGGVDVILERGSKSTIWGRLLCLQSSDSGPAEGCEGPRLHPPSSPVMLQVNRRCCCSGLTW